MTWQPFSTWLLRHALLDLTEVSRDFPKHAYNGLFRQQLAQVDTPEAQQQAAQLSDFDWVGYIARSLRNAGFQGADVDPQVHETVIRLLLRPGQLFAGWDGKSPIDARFKTSVRNAIYNLLEKRQTRRRRIPSTSIGSERGGVGADDITARSEPADEEVVDDFRRLVRNRLGALAEEIFNQRLSAQEIKSLVGAPEFGEPSAYAVKTVVKAIKQLAVEFARTRGDDVFLRMIQRAMAGEQQTLARRFGTAAAVA
jgi:DNA-directed RNA polymerase specialized sigma24 family protein